MAEPLKHVYSESFIDKLLACWAPIFPKLNKNKIKAFIFSDDWESLELKQRMSRLSDAMINILPASFKEAAPIVYSMVDELERKEFPKRGYEYMFIPDYVEKSGRAYPEISLPLLARITRFVSAEFAIRPFIVDNPQKSMSQMLKWSLSDDIDIKRLSSEGCRSRLPWATALPAFKKDASPILPILENLKNDDSLYVRKSVANNLNDISKDHPELALSIASTWYGENKNTDWIVKHGLRTLLKAGNSEAMKLFNYTAPENLLLSDLTILTPVVSFGNELQFSFSIKNTSNKKAKIRLEYALYFLKQNGSQTKKVFKISERELLPAQELNLLKSHKIKAISTRKYYPGMHAVTLIVNGIESKKETFLLDM